MAIFCMLHNYYMRIIAGDYKGRKLESPVGNRVRPTTDKVKEAIFSMLCNDTYDRVFADIFAGTGNMGIEALSRGAAKCYFGDNDRDSIRLVKSNIAHCGADEKAIVMAGGFERVIQRIPEKVDVFILDPPYADGLMVKCIDTIIQEDKLADEGIIIAEHGKREDLPETIGNLTKYRERKYSHVKVSVYRNF